MKNEKIVEAYDTIHPGIDAKRRIHEKIMRRHANKRPTKRFITVAAAIVILLAISTAAFINGDWFVQQFNPQFADIAGQSPQENFLQGNTIADTSLSLIDTQSHTPNVPPAEIVYPSPAEQFWHGVENVVLNPPLDPTDDATAQEVNIVDVIFICNIHANLLPRNLVISTPGSFTIPGPNAVNPSSSATFLGWRDVHGNLWTIETFMSWNIEVSGNLTLTAEWS